MDLDGLPERLGEILDITPSLLADVAQDFKGRAVERAYSEPRLLHVVVVRLPDGFEPEAGDRPLPAAPVHKAAQIVVGVGHRAAPSSCVSRTSAAASWGG